MQTPPPFNRPPEGQYYQQPMKPKKNPVLIVFAILGVLGICCALPLGAIGYFGFKGFQGSMGMISCYANADMMSRALKDYSAANNGKLPPAATWQTDIAKYFKVDKEIKESPFKIWTSGGEWSCGSEGSKTGFMFNAELGGKVAADVIKTNPETPVIFETKTVAFNQSGKYQPLPFDESPRLLDSFDQVKERRGWILVTADAKLGAIGKKGKFKVITSGSGSAFNFDVSTEESNKSNASDTSSNGDLNSE